MEFSGKVFDVRNGKAAREVILTPQGGLTSEDRWQTETPYLIDLLASNLPVDALGHTVLDYGCGIGRLSKPYAEIGSLVVGVDTSWSMRALATDYVRSDLFMSCSPEWLEILVGVAELRFGLALCVWVLQHLKNPGRELVLIESALEESGGYLFVVNDHYRIVPQEDGLGNFRWFDDGIDIRDMIRKAAKEVVVEGTLDPEVVGEIPSASSFWGIYKF